MTERTQVVIIGSGTAGAVLALVLARAGIDCRLLERAPAPPTGIHVEILQPNGQRLLAQLGILAQLPEATVRRMRIIDFLAEGGERLLTVDYGRLPAPYNRAMTGEPQVMNALILRELEAARPGATSYGVEFMGLARTGRTMRVSARRADATLEIEARLVVGADGARSIVRERLGLPAAAHLYRDAYLVAQLDDPDHMSEGRYTVGRHRILAMFPNTRGRVAVAYMIRADGLPALKSEGVASLRERWTAIDPAIAKVAANLVDWQQTGFLRPVRVRAERWVTDGGAIIGDAAHAMNPHASQGRMQAMLDAVALADVAITCAAADDWSAARLAEFERLRRPQVETLQRLADEQVWLWNTGNVLLTSLRNRIFRSLDRNPRLSYRVLSTTAGLRTTPPFTLLDRLMAAGLVPDPHADEWEPGQWSASPGGAS